MTYSEGQVYPRGAGAGCGGLAIWQPGWATVFFLDIWINTANDAPVVLKKVSTFSGELHFGSSPYMREDDSSKY